MVKVDDLYKTDMTVEHLKCIISKNKNLRSRMSGYSSLNKQELIESIRRLLENPDDVIKKRKQVKSSWNEALMKFNDGKGSFTIPKKGSEDYNKVKAIQEKLGSYSKPVAKQVKKVSQKPYDDSQDEVPISKLVSKKVPKSSKIQIVEEPDEFQEVVETKTKTKPKQKRSKVIIQEPVVELPAKRIRKKKVIVDM